MTVHATVPTSCGPGLPLRAPELFSTVSHAGQSSASLNVTPGSGGSVATIAPAAIPGASKSLLGPVMDSLAAVAGAGAGVAGFAPPLMDADGAVTESANDFVASGETPFLAVTVQVLEPGF